MQTFVASFFEFRKPVSHNHQLLVHRARFYDIKVIPVVLSVLGKFYE